MNNNDIDLKNIYVEILDGSTEISDPEFGIFFYKHQNIQETLSLDRQRDSFINQAIKRGIPTNKERENDLIKSGFWDTEKNLEIFGLKESLSRLHVTKTKVFQQAQIDAVNREIELNQKKITTLEQEKTNLLGLTAETLANSRINDLFLKNIFFKDPQSKQKLFSDEQFNDLENEQILYLQKIFEKIINKFMEQNIKKISISPIFLGSFCLAENAFEFYGKPIIQLTIFQNQLFKWGNFYKNLVTKCENTIPEDVLSDPDKIEEFCNASKNAKEHLDKKPPGTMLMGNNTNIGASNPTINTLIEKAKKKGGSLDMGDVFNLR